MQWSWIGIQVVTHSASNKIDIPSEFPSKGKFWRKIIEVHVRIRERRRVRHERVKTQDIDKCARDEIFEQSTGLGFNMHSYRVRSAEKRIGLHTSYPEIHTVARRHPGKVQNYPPPGCSKACSCGCECYEKSILRTNEVAALYTK